MSVIIVRQRVPKLIHPISKENIRRIWMISPLPGKVSGCHTVIVKVNCYFLLSNLSDNIRRSLTKNINITRLTPIVSKPIIDLLLLLFSPETFLYRLVKIWSVIAEIFLPFVQNEASRTSEIFRNSCDVVVVVDDVVVAVVDVVNAVVDFVVVDFVNIVVVVDVIFVDDVDAIDVAVVAAKVFVVVVNVVVDVVVVNIIVVNVVFDVVITLLMLLLLFISKNTTKVWSKAGK